jgi:ABC-type transport system involved in cytochrome bd biosynthesis fused ATPase/permease subunit
MEGDFMGNLLSEDVLVPLAAFAMVVLLVGFSYKLKKARVQEQGELRKRLLDKFSSGTELTEFLATPQGQSFLKDQEASAAQRSPKVRIISSIGAGIVLLLLGIAFFGLMHLKQGFVYPGIILMALGVGILIAAAISYRLYKKWNMI